MRHIATTVNHATGTPRFVRRTRLCTNEYRKNFRQVDCDIIAALTSPEADAVTPLMSKVYLRLVNAPAQYWERDGVLRFEAELRDQGHIKAWDVLCQLLGVASATASKALRWMHAQGIIGYFSGKNGVGLRIFLNRASSSIGQRAAGEDGTRAAGEKILEFGRASSRGAAASRDEAAFSDSYADSEALETDLRSRAPEDGAEATPAVKHTPLVRPTSVGKPTPLPPLVPGREAESRGPAGTQTLHPAAATTATAATAAAAAEELTELLLVRLEPVMRAAAAQAAAREHERTRQWLESRGLPKAARVAQREAFDLLRRHGLVGAAAAARMQAAARVGTRRLREPEEEEAERRLSGEQERHLSREAEARPLSEEEVRELAETCAAMLEVHGKAVDVTLRELSAEAGAVLPGEDLPRVRELAEAIARGCGKGEQLVVFGGEGAGAGDGG